MESYRNKVNDRGLASLGINPLIFDDVDSDQVRECIEEFNSVVEQIISVFPESEFLAFIYLHKCYEPDDIKLALKKRFAKEIEVDSIIRYGNRAKNRLLDVLPKDKRMIKWRETCSHGEKIAVRIRIKK